MMAAGMGCKCAARSQYDCCCDDVDWRSQREIDLEAEVIALNEQVERLCKIGTPPVCPHCKCSMTPCNFEGYYDEFAYWACQCDEIPGAERVRGAYA